MTTKLTPGTVQFAAPAMKNHTERQEGTQGQTQLPAKPSCWKVRRLRRISPKSGHQWLITHRNKGEQGLRGQRRTEGFPPELYRA